MAVLPREDSRFSESGRPRKASTPSRTSLSGESAKSAATGYRTSLHDSARYPFSEEAKRKRRGGRPKKDPGKKRSAQLHVLLTPAERDRVKEWAASTNLSVSDYVRRRTLGKPIAPRVDMKAQGELNRIGVNLNQLARAANEAGQVELAAEARAVFGEVRQAVRALRLPAEAPPEIPHYPFRRIDDDG